MIFLNKLMIFLGVGKSYYIMKDQIKMVDHIKCSKPKHRNLFVNKPKAIKKIYAFFSSIYLSYFISLIYTPSFLNLSLFTNSDSKPPDFRDCKPSFIGQGLAKRYPLALYLGTSKKIETRRKNQVFFLHSIDHVS